MKRRPKAFRIAVFLLLLVAGGAIVNVAVAWGFCLRQTRGSPRIATWEEIGRNVDRLFGSDLSLPADGAFGMVSHNAGVDSEIYGTSPIGLPPGRSSIVNAGWPVRALHGEKTTIGATSHDSHFYLPFGGKPRIPLPIHPIWPGFAINTVFYAFILWLVFAAPFALRRLRGGRRIKRGLCPKCAYPRGAGTNQVCTECGAAVAVPSKRAG